MFQRMAFEGRSNELERVSIRIIIKFALVNHIVLRAAKKKYTYTNNNGFGSAAQ